MYRLQYRVIVQDVTPARWHKLEGMTQTRYAKPIELRALAQVWSGWTSMGCCANYNY